MEAISLKGAIGGAVRQGITHICKKEIEEAVE